LLKVIGAILILGATGAFGLSFAFSQRYRLQDLEEMKRAILLLKHQIGFFALPLPQAMEEVSEKVREGVGEIFFIASQLLDKEQTQEVAVLWQRALEEGEKKTNFSKQDKEMFVTFGKTLGYPDREQQMASADFLLSYLEETQKKLGEGQGEKKRFYCSMGILCGLLFVVVLL